MTDESNYLELYTFAEMRIKDLERELHEALLLYDEAKKHCRKLENRLRSLYIRKDRGKMVLRVDRSIRSVALDVLYKILTDYCNENLTGSYMEWPELDKLRSYRIIPEPVFLKTLARKNRTTSDVYAEALKEFKEVCTLLTEDELAQYNRLCPVYVPHYRIPD